MTSRTGVAGNSYQKVNGNDCPRRNSWTQTEENRLIILWSRGLTLREIGEAMGLSRKAVCGKAKSLGLKLPEEVKQQRLRMSPGRPPKWADCPPDLYGEYRRLQRKGYTSAEARDVLLGHCA